MSSYKVPRYFTWFRRPIWMAIFGWWLGYLVWHLSQKNVSGPDNKSTLVQVTAWCRQATSRYLNQCWLKSMSSYDATIVHSELRCDDKSQHAVPYIARNIMEKTEYFLEKHSHCLLNRLLKRRSKKLSKLRVTDLCERNSQWRGKWFHFMTSSCDNLHRLYGISGNKNLAFLRSSSTNCVNTIIQPKKRK